MMPNFIETTIGLNDKISDITINVDDIALLNPRNDGRTVITLKTMINGSAIQYVVNEDYSEIQLKLGIGGGGIHI